MSYIQFLIAIISQKAQNWSDIIRSPEKVAKWPVFSHKMAISWSQMIQKPQV